MRTKTMSEIGRIYVDKNSGNRDGRDYLLTETHKKSGNRTATPPDKSRQKCKK